MKHILKIRMLGLRESVFREDGFVCLFQEDVFLWDSPGKSVSLIDRHSTVVLRGRAPARRGNSRTSGEAWPLRRGAAAPAAASRP